MKTKYYWVLYNRKWNSPIIFEYLLSDNHLKEYVNWVCFDWELERGGAVCVLTNSHNLSTTKVDENSLSARRLGFPEVKGEASVLVASWQPAAVALQQVSL